MSSSGRSASPAPRALLLCLLGLAAPTASAQFPVAFGSPGQEYGKCLAVDPFGRVVVGGLFEGSVDVDPGPGIATLSSEGAVDALVVRYDRRGRLENAFRFGGAGITVPHGIATDAAGDVWVAGYTGLFGGAPTPADFDPGPGTLTLTPGGGVDPFLAKYDRQGRVLWARLLVSTSAAASDERAWDLAVSPSGDVYVTGLLNGTVDLDGGPGSAPATSAGGTDGFVAAYSPDGSFRWGFAVGGAGADEAFAVALAPDGTLVLQGHFSGTIDLDPGPGVAQVTSAGGTDLFLARYTSGGAFLSAVTLGSGGNETTPPGALRVDLQGNVVFSGRFRGTLDLDPGSGTANVTNPGASDNLFLLSLSPSFDYRWGFSVVSDGALDGGHRVAIDRFGAVTVGGWFGGTADFDGGPGTASRTSRATDGATDVFVARYGPDGAFRWVATFGADVSGADQLSILAGLAVDHEGAAFATGQYFGSMDADPGPATNPLPNAGRNDFFVFALEPDGSPRSDRSETVVPIVLDVTSGYGRYTTELTLTNPSAAAADVSLAYTASLGSGSGSGSVTLTLGAGESRLVPDTLAYLRAGGLALPASSLEPQQGGTLRVSSPAVVVVLARTTAATGPPLPTGAAGLAYGASAPPRGFTGRAAVFGLRRDATDRANLAVQNLSGAPITLRATLHAGDGTERTALLEETRDLPPWGFHQWNDLFASTPFASGSALLERVAGEGTYFAYGVVNDAVTNDGSFLAAVDAEAPVSRLTVPVLVETGAFESELVLANPSDSPVSLRLAFDDSLSSAGGGVVTFELGARTQRILPSALDEMRRLGLAVPARGAAGLAGSLSITADRAVPGLFAAARTGTPAAPRFGLFTPGVPAGAASEGEATVHGLAATADRRSNLALLHAGSASDGAVTLEVAFFDGSSGGAEAGPRENVTIDPGGWVQLANPLAGRGVGAGWARVVRRGGTAPWIAYGVLNDGGAPGERTGDGAYLEATR